jgi:hypothetical protein
MAVWEGGRGFITPGFFLYKQRNFCYVMFKKTDLLSLI